MHTILDRLGRRGLTLLLAGIAWGVFGWALLDLPGEHGPGILRHVPATVLGISFMVSGAIGMAHSLARRPAHDALGFAILAIVPAVWTIGSFWSWVTYLVWGQGASYDWANAVLWAWFTANLVIASGWTETAHLHGTDPTERGEDDG